ncbi:MAG: hypothetical protein ACRDRI_06230 [Pseudonocardiaceae bacterium]
MRREDAKGGGVTGSVAGPAFTEGVVGFGRPDAAGELGWPGVLEDVEDVVPVGEAVVDEGRGAVAEDGGSADRQVAR